MILRMENIKHAVSRKKEKKKKKKAANTTSLPTTSILILAHKAGKLLIREYDGASAGRVHNLALTSLTSPYF